MTPPVLHDCDPGNDDALAILAALGSATIDLKAVTAGAGHLASDRTAQNAAITLGVARSNFVPVTRGAEGPLVRERLIAQLLDFEGGLDPERGDLPAVAIQPNETSAEMIARLATQETGLTIVTTGPLTNLALALRTAPTTASRLGRIVMLAGAWGLGNKTAAAEWNALCDPEAVAIVFACGAPLILVPIDAAAQVTIDDALVDTIGAPGGPVASFAAELLRSLRSTYRPGPFGPPEAPLNDPLAVLVAANPNLTRRMPARVDIELAGKHTYGRTVMDFAGRSALGPNCQIVVEFDVAASRRAFIEAISALN